jgi:hypothetical protein
MLSTLIARLAVPRRELSLYVGVFLALGIAMNSAGKILQIAEFLHWWQVGTCYLLYLLPLALWLRTSPVVMQFVWSVMALIPLELGGYAMGTSRPIPDNVIERIMGPHNFTLVMVLVGACMPVLGNAIVQRLKGGDDDTTWSAP